MYKICSQFLIVLSCVMLMVVSLQVDYVMIACILTGIIVCTFIDMQGVPQMSPAKESKTADRAFDLILAVYILSGVFFAPSFFMLPYAAMVFRKRKYTASRMAAALVGIVVSVDCILKIKHIAPGIFYILEVVLLMAFAVMLSYFTELLLGYQMKMHSMRKSVHDLYDESVDLRQALAKLKPTDSAFAFSLEYDCEDDVPRDVKYAFIAIAKEAVNNAVKHSNGDEIRIIVREHPAFYQLEIMDNGTSADERSLTGETGDGIGIKNIKERVAAIGGTMRIKADDGFMIFVTLMKK